MQILWTRTGRGFVVGLFNDQYGSQCSLQKSSLATEDCIWLGVDEPFDNPGHPNKDRYAARMHLSQDNVAALLPALQAFVETGELPLPAEQDK